ncbi:ImmA/IrrE family metallo-endopeptidase [Dyella koreensis]|uniref:ImmA/IrrE family metallo-endopeptidase n=1 Tax=Dyella koreensis TaxID=311235 RepID=A0ABW8K835_9GAMM
MNTKTPVVSAKSAYESLAAAGFPKAYVTRLLPDWWDNALFKTSGGAIEFASILRQRLGIDVHFAKNGELEVSGMSTHARFKRRSTTAEGELQVCATLGMALAKLALYCSRIPYTPLPQDPAAVGALIRASIDRNTVSFDALLDFCWSRGLPVLFLKDLPRGSKRIAGMALQVDARPAIVLGYQSSQDARQLFVLAHELAHICLGHVAATGALIDEGLSAVTDALQGADAVPSDAEERQADAFALTLLRNGKAARLGDGARFASAAELAVSALATGKSRGIDVGHLILSYAKDNDDWLMANQALAYLPDNADALTSVRERFIANADLERLTEENRSYLLSVQGF